jgi:transcriptional regulator with XRE-family HTH domain
MLTRRGRTRLTQQQLAERLGVSTRTVQYWETGVSYPAGANLRHLIEIYLDQGAFTRGAEGSEARAVWDSAAFETPRLAAPFDAIRFEPLLTRHTLGRPVPGVDSVAHRQVGLIRFDGQMA